jgi:hypothetical protein
MPVAAATFTVQGHAMINGIPADGLTCAAFLEETWFPVGTPSPVLNQALPGPPDASTVSGAQSGGKGTFLMTVPQSGSYWIACYAAAAPAQIAWEKVLSHPHTAWQGWTVAHDVTFSRSIVTTQQGTNGPPYTFPKSTINVVSTAGFASSGWLFVQDDGGFVPAVLVQYTGIGATTFTGCTGGTSASTFGNGDFVCQAWINGNYRRMATVTIQLGIVNPGDGPTASGYTTLGGGTFLEANVSIVSTSGTYGLTSFQVLPMQVDPGGAYGIVNNVGLGGTGTVSLNRWVEVDF